jgi:hypothetical protein
MGAYIPHSGRGWLVTEHGRLMQQRTDAENVASE